MEDTSKCPLNDNEIDVIPESYHYANRCICFLCICGQHICPVVRKNFATRESYKTDYKRSYSRPSMTPTKPRVRTAYQPNRHKMDLETEYRKKFNNFTIETVQVSKSSTPQPNFKMEASTQYNRDYPNWGPVEHYSTKRPVHPIHETKLKFQGKSSYDTFFKAHKFEENSLKGKSSISKHEKFVVPLQTSSQRDYKKIDSGHFPKHAHREIEEYVPLAYNPGQFKSVSRESYIESAKHYKDPYLMRKKALVYISKDVK